MRPKKSLETNCLKKRIFWGTKCLGLFFRIIESNKPQGTIHKGTQAVLTITVDDL